jgi:hypothetical protein
MQRQNPPHYILIYTSAERQIDLLGNTQAAPRWIPPFHFDYSTNDVGTWTFWSRFRPPLWRKEQPILSPDQCPMKLK